MNAPCCLFAVFAIFLAGTIPLAAQDSGGREVTFTTISTDTNSPIADTEVIVRRGDETLRLNSDEFGQIRFDILDEDAYLRVTVREPHYVPMRAVWQPKDDRVRVPDAYTIEIPRGTVIGGVIHDASADPIENATVSLLVPNEQFETRTVPAIWDHTVTTGSEGRWTTDIMPAEMADVWIKLSHDDYADDNRYGETPKPTMDQLREQSGIMIMRTGLTLTGRVTDQDGKPIAKASVAQGDDRWGSHFPKTKTDENGVYGFPNTQPASVILTVQRTGFGPELKRVSFDADTGSVDFTMGSAHTVHGIARDGDGNPLPGVTVVADTWRNYRSISFRTKTNSKGEFKWSSAPGDEVLYDILKQDYMSVRNVAMMPQDAVHEVVLHKPLVITGTVIDAETQQPVSSFAVLEGIDWKNGNNVSWNRGNDVRQGENGRYAMTHTYPYPGHLVRIEADGYRPAISRVFDNGEGEVTFDFELKRAEPLHGFVATATGAPVHGADVVFCTPTGGAYIENGYSRRHGRGIESKTDAEGRFEFPPTIETFTLVILADDGFAEVPEKDFDMDEPIILSPWATVEGILRVGASPRPHEKVTLNFQRPWAQHQPIVTMQYSTTTDANGLFKFTRVSPGDARVGRYLALTESSSTTTHAKAVPIVPGESSYVEIGGTGRPVTGRVTIPEGYAGEIDWGQSHRSINLVLNTPESPEDVQDRGSEAIRDWHRAWQKSPAGIAHAEARRHYAFLIAQDGSFAIDDIPSGTYTLSVTANEPAPNGQCGFGAPIGSVSATFEVPAMDQIYLANALDIGNHELVVRTTLHVGERAPAFDALDLDSGTVRLADYAGKVLLLDFWATWCGPCVTETPNLIKLYDEFKDDPDFAMVGLSLDQSVGTARTFVQNQKMVWDQGYLGNWGQTQVPNEYGVYAIPATMVIGPDGRLLARDLGSLGSAAAIRRALANLK